MGPLDLLYSIQWIHVAVEDLNCGCSKLKCSVSVEYISYFEDLM